MHLGFPRPGVGHLSPERHRFERQQVGLHRFEPSHGSHAGRDDGLRRHPLVVHRVLQRDEGAEGVSEDGVAVQAERTSQHDHVLGVPLQGPGAFRRHLRAAAGSEVDEQQPVAALGQRIEVIGELVMVEAGPAVQHDHRVALAAVDHPQRGVVDADQTALIGHGGEPHPSRPTMRNPESLILYRRFTLISSGVSVSVMRAIDSAPQSIHRRSGMSLDQSTDHRLRFVVVAAHQHVGIQGMLEVGERVRGDRVERRDHPRAFAQQRSGLLGRRSVPWAQDLPGSATHRGGERAGRVHHDRARPNAPGDRSVDVGLPGEGNGDHQHVDGGGGRSRSWCP